MFNVVLQESIIKHVNEHPEAGWEAAMNPRFSNYTVSLQFVLCCLNYLEPFFYILLIFTY